MTGGEAVPPPGPPEQGRVQVMALAYIRAWLDEDYWTMDRIAAALADAGATMPQVAEVFALMAASLLTEAHGGSSHAAADHAAARQDDEVARHVRLLSHDRRPGDRRVR
jgi:hypothetical protein